MPPDPFDLEAYLSRIGHDGAREPSLPVLANLVARHTAAIAFENIDALAGRPIPLDLVSLQRKLVGGGRGGYCYEQNTLFQGALRTLGFTVSGLMARVRRGVPPGVDAPRSHMLLLVDLPEGPYLADVGFGGLTPTAPLALRAGDEQTTPNETFRLLPNGAEFMLQARIATAWADVYQFSLQPQLPIDYEMANWFTATRPKALFVENLVVTLPNPGVRRTIFNRHFSRRDGDGPSQWQILRTRDDYDRVLHEEFALAPTGSDMDAILARVERYDPDAPPGGHFA